MPSCTVTHSGIEPQAIPVPITTDSLGEDIRRRLANEVDRRIHAYLWEATISDLSILRAALDGIEKIKSDAGPWPGEDAPFAYALLCALGMVPK